MSVQRLFVAALAVLFAGSSVRAQIRDQVVVYGADGVTGHPLVMRYGHDLTVKGTTDLISVGPLILSDQNQICVDSQGRYWIANDALSFTYLVRVAADGTLLPTTVLGHNPNDVVCDRFGGVFSITRIPLLSPGPMYGVLPDGSVQWVNWDGPSNYTWYPRYSAVRANGELWFGGSTPGVPHELWAAPMLKEIDRSTGSVKQTVYPPAVNAANSADSFMTLMQPSPDGTLWMGIIDYSMTSLGMYQYNGPTLVRKVLVADWSPTFAHATFRLGPAGDLWWSSSTAVQGGSLLYRYSRVDGSLVASYSMPGGITGFAFGATGEDVFAAYSVLQAGQVLQSLARTNLVTGVRSTVPLVPPLHSGYLGPGDPTGFVFSNVTDQDGDNDGDGATNRSEIIAGSNPYDLESRPTGPKAYLSFLPGTNAVSIRLHDPDGVLHPTRGLDPATISIQAGPYGEIFPLLLSFVSNVAISADGLDATLDFGLLPIPSFLKIRMAVTVRDKKGAIGKDWQVTPPGDL